MTIEIQNGRIVQALQRFNDPLTADQQEAVDAWNEHFSKKGKGGSMINIHELTTDHKIKLKKPMGCFDNLGEVCEIVKIDTDENVINFRFGVDGVHLGVMSGDELEKIF